MEIDKDKVEIVKEQILDSVSSGNMYPNVARLLNVLLDEALNMRIVMPQLLCIDDSDFIWITKHKKYILITEDNGDYIIRDDEDDIVGVPKKHFKFIEAQ